MNEFDEVGMAGSSFSDTPNSVNGMDMNSKVHYLTQRPDPSATAIEKVLKAEHDAILATTKTFENNLTKVSALTSAPKSTPTGPSLFSRPRQTTPTPRPTPKSATPTATLFSSPRGPSLFSMRRPTPTAKTAAISKEELLKKLAKAPTNNVYELKLR